MTGLELKTQFELIVGDTLDTTFAYQLMTQAKNKIEMDLKLHILVDVDTSQMANVGDTYLSMKTLNTNVRVPIKVVVSNLPYFPIRFIAREAFRNAARRYYIDWKNKQFALTGTTAQSATINMYFLTKTADLTEDNENTDGIITWPDEFQPLIPYIMASIFQANLEADAVSSFYLSPAQRGEAQNIKDALIAWDHDIKLAEMGNVGGFQSDQEGGTYDLFGQEIIDLGRF